MNERRRDEAQLLGEWIEKLERSNKLIIVEGSKDEEALEGLGISPERIFKTNKSRALIFLAEELSKKGCGVIILTDLDKEGKRIYRKLSSELQRNGIEVDNYFREFLFRNTRLRQIEGIKNYFEKAKENRKM